MATNTQGNTLNPISWIDQLLQQSPAYKNYKDQEQARILAMSMPPTADQAGQVAAQQNSPPPIGPLASEKMSADGTIERKYHPPEQPMMAGQPNSQETSKPQSPAKDADNAENNKTTGTESPKGLIPNRNFLGFGGPDNEGNVRDTGTGIKILQLLAGGGVANPAATAQVQQTMQGKQPMQRKEKIEQTAGIYSTQLNSFDKQIEDEKSTQAVLVQEQQNVLKNRIFGIIGIPAYTKRYGELQRQLDESRKRLFGDPAKGIKGLMDLKGQLLAKPPVVESDKNNATNKAPKGATHYSPSLNKYYDAKGNEVK